MRLKTIQKPEELLDFAFRSAAKKAKAAKLPKERKIKFFKSREIIKVEVFANSLGKRLNECVKEFPKIDELHPFYRELIYALVDVAELKKALAQMKATAKIVERLKRKYISKLKALQRREEEKSFSLSKEFFGRAASAIKKLNEAIEIYNSAVKKMQEMPSIDFRLPTVIVAGYPNTGKTTILKRLTGSSPEIASYPFTTKGIMVGYFEEGFKKIQVIDTPGLLDRPMEKRNAIERKAIAALKYLGNVIVFVIDPTMYCGFPLDKQINLLEEIKKEFKIPLLVVLNKADLASKSEIENAKKEIGEMVLEGEGIRAELKEKILEKLNKF